MRRLILVVGLVGAVFTAAQPVGAATKWSITLSASPGTSVSAGTPVILLATANKDVGPTPYTLDVLDVTNPTSPVEICSAADGAICRAAPQVYASATSRTYVARIETDIGVGIQTTSKKVKITWKPPSNSGWSVKLTASPGTSVSQGTGVTLTATSSANVTPTPYSIDIYDQTHGIQICSADTDTTCVSDPRALSSAGGIVYVAKVEMSDGTSVQATSSTVSVSWGGGTAWSVSLTASPGTSVNTGTGVTLKAHASQAVDGSGFVIDIYDTTAGGGPICTVSTGTDCSSPAQSYGSATTHTYVAKVEKTGGTNVQATSSAVQVTWSAAPPPWGVTLTPSPGTSVNTGTGVTLTAHANQSVDGTGFVVDIYDMTAGGSSICSVSMGTDCVTPSQSYNTQTMHTFVARVEKSNGTSVQATSSQVQVTWGTPSWRVTLTASPGTTVNTTMSVTLTAHSSRSLTGSGYIVDVYDTTNSTQGVKLGGCASSSDCPIPSQTYGFVTTHTYAARVEHSGGVNVQATGTLTVNWVDWYFTQVQTTPQNGHVSLGQTATVSFTATQPVDTTGFVIHIYDVNNLSTPIATCTTGATCATTTPAYTTNTTHNYSAAIEHSDRSSQQASSSPAQIVWGTGGAQSGIHQHAPASASRRRGSALVCCGGKVRAAVRVQRV